MASPSALLREAVERAIERLAQRRNRFRVREIRPSGGDAQQWIDLSRIATVEPPPAIDARCPAARAELEPRLPPAVQRAALIEQWSRSPAGRSASAVARREVEARFEAGADELYVGCATSAGARLVVLDAEPFDRVVMRWTGSELRPFAPNAVAATTAVGGEWSAVEHRAYADVDGDRVDDLVVIAARARDDERWIEVLSPASERVAHYAFRRQICSIDCAATGESIACRDRALPLVHAVFDRDRWLLRVGTTTLGLDTHRRLLPTTPSDPDVAGWLEFVRAQELRVASLGRILSRDSSLLRNSRSEIEAALIALGERDEDARRGARQLGAP
ncbi:MAG: hypothetical protein JNK05_04835 [Myxococcales bacterium]|nr:hypothetical protein [Myxococcales bacterium]